MPYKYLTNENKILTWERNPIRELIAGPSYPTDYVAAYQLEELSGKIAYDDSANHYDASIYGDVSLGETGIVGYCYKTSPAVPSCIRLLYADVLSGAPAFTISMWVKTISTGTQYQLGADWAVTTTHFFRISTGVLLQCYAWCGGSQYGGTTQNYPNDNAWHHVIFRWDGSVISSYIDNVIGGTTYNTTGALGTGNVMGIGCRDDGGYTLNGWIDQVRYYRRALSEEEIAQLWNNGAGI